MERMRFRASKVQECIEEHPWLLKIDGMEVTFEDSNIAWCGNYCVIKDWCEPINNSDNNDK